MGSVSVRRIYKSGVGGGVIYKFGGWGDGRKRVEKGPRPEGVFLGVWGGHFKGFVRTPKMVKKGPRPEGGILGVRRALFGGFFGFCEDPEKCQKSRKKGQKWRKKSIFGQK